jgi:hypothetical protein
MDHISDSQIRQRAFELWERHGASHGHDTEFWLQAERELQGGENLKGVSVNAASNRSGSGSDGPAR